MRSIIKSSDAEKLIPYTAAEIMKLEEEYYDKLIDSAMLRRYVILKAYTFDDMEAFGKNMTLGTAAPVILHSETPDVTSDETALLSPTSNNADDSQAQFFTPTTKKALEEVNQQCVRPTSINSPSSTAKRNINFETITVEDLGNAPSQLPESIVGTPKKKNKGPENNV